METGRWNYEDLHPEIEQNKLEFKKSFGTQDNKVVKQKDNDKEVEKEMQTSLEKCEKGI